MLNLIRINQKYKKKFFKYNFLKNEKSLIKKLIQLNVIKFVKKENNSYLIFLNYKHNKPVFSLKCLFKQSNLKSISIKIIKQIIKKNYTTFIISTNKGIITSKEAIKKNHSGTLIAKVYYNSICN